MVGIEQNCGSYFQGPIDLWLGRFDFEEKQRKQQVEQGGWNCRWWRQPDLELWLMEVMRTPNGEIKVGLKKGAWDLEEDQKLISYINRYGIWNWSHMPKFAEHVNHVNDIPNPLFSWTSEDDNSSSNSVPTPKGYGVEFIADHHDVSSPGTIEDLQCFWRQLCPFENLELGNIHQDMFSDNVYND
ncbi:hypothetical protein Ccrd_000939, partial [Cynara cardunculus var. scolymus]